MAEQFGLIPAFAKPLDCARYLRPRMRPVLLERQIQLLPDEFRARDALSARRSSEKNVSLAIESDRRRALS